MRILGRLRDRLRPSEPLNWQEPKPASRIARHEPRPPRDTAVRGIELEILDAGDEDLPSIATRIAGLSDPREVLDGLARSRNDEVRDWVPALAVGVLGDHAMPLLMRLFRDRDPDVRGLAFDAIERLDPTAPERLLPKLRKRLSSLNDDEVISTAWVMVRLRDTASLPAIESYLEAVSDQPTWWQHKAASVIRMALADPDAVGPTIRGHDHERMAWLTHAAVVVGSGACLEALAWGREQLPDEQCKQWCRHAIEVDLPKEARLRK